MPAIPFLKRFINIVFFGFETFIYTQRTEINFALSLSRHIYSLPMIQLSFLSAFFIFFIIAEGNFPGFFSVFWTRLFLLCFARERIEPG